MWSPLLRWEERVTISCGAERRDPGAAVGQPFPNPREEEAEAWRRGLPERMVGAKKACVALEMLSRHVVAYRAAFPGDSPVL